ncbi:hypothetical protein [Bacteroides sp.]
MFNNETIQSVWEKGHVIEGYDAHIIRKDPSGAWIMRNEYSNMDSKFGWVIDHVYPESLGGDDNIANLRPMQWENNNAKSGDYPTYRAVVQAEGNENVYIEAQYTVNESLRNRLSKLYNI